MNRIHLLPEHVANQIAAGEVIERPASVLKELIENSIDAGASQIDVQIAAGGRSLVSVTDNGCGMSKDDALLCLERHATSKLRVTDDLNHIASFGFRGEAIPSIASVSKFRLRSREVDSISGTEVVIDGGKLLAVRDAGLAPGTQIEVRSLFYNLPARRKFLKSDATETAQLRHTLLLAGLARPDIGFTFAFDDSPPQRWFAGEDLSQRLISVFGADWKAQTQPILAQNDDLKLHGFVGKPGISRAAKNEELFFVNNRPVDNRTLHFGLLEGYHNSVMKGRYPVAVLFLQIDPADLDVNIHPAKREVRFHDDFKIRYFIVQAIRNCLQAYNAGPVVSIQLDPPEPDLTSQRVVASAPELPALSIGLGKAHPFPEPSTLVNPTSPVPPSSFIEKQGPSTPSEKPLIEPIIEPVAELIVKPAPAIIERAVPMSLPFDESRKVVPLRSVRPVNAPIISNRLGLKVMGCVADLYLVATSADGLVLVDQHAAHERVLFEQMLARMSAQDPGSQQLLFPATVTLPPREADFLHAQLETLQHAGIGVTAFGPTAFLIDALPVMMQSKVGDLGEFLRNLVSELQSEGGDTRKSRRLSEEIVAKTVCRHAVKANDALRPEEWDQLLIDLLACDLPYTCPHGRPTMILISLSELEKKFGRVV